SKTAEYEDLGDDRLLGHQRTEVRGSASGATVEMDYWVLITFRDRKVIREEWFFTREEALRAAGAPD
ncbi:MAG TPA: hypothetical protein VHF58_10235, partial [Solirubrobacterales bacterium]|nr:hypothetical protein [Solirubrobacterales bacterium]